jgi:hypothetical protein
VRVSTGIAVLSQGPRQFIRPGIFRFPGTTIEHLDQITSGSGFLGRPMANVRMRQQEEAVLLAHLGHKVRKFPRPYISVYERRDYVTLVGEVLGSDRYLKMG